MFFIDDEEFTRHGYYLINGIKTLSKFEAWKLSNNKFEDIKFIFNDNIMDQYDWTVEPEEDIYELYAERARQLRNNYDYLVLLYSGGIDSHNILQCFLDNNIQLNEICTFSNTNVELKTDKFNQEVFNRAIPFINSLNLNSTGTKFRLIDISNLVINQYSNIFHFENSLHYFNGPSNNWSNTVRSCILKTNIPEHLKISEKGKKICYIWGFDKPVINVINDKYYLHFADSAVDINIHQYINRVELKSKLCNFYDEPFFISKDCVKISIKQAHMLVKYMHKIQLNDKNLIYQNQLANTGPFVVHHKNQFYKFLTKKMVDSVIYPKSIMDMFVNDKLKGSVILTARDNWFNKSTHDNQNRWSQNLNNIVKNNINFFKFEDNKLISSKYILSKPYLIGNTLT
jgi:hypothetical protein